MSNFLSGIFKWVGAKAVIFLLILILLLACVWIRGELKKAEQQKKDRDVQVALRQTLVAQSTAPLREAWRQLDTAKSVADKLQSTMVQKRKERQLLEDRHAIARYNPFTPVGQQIVLLDAEIAIYRKALDAANQRNESTEKKLKTLEVQVNQAIEQIEKRIASIDEILEKDSLGRWSTAIDRQLPVALWILVAVVLAPIATKVFLYFVIAPWATGREPIRILPMASGNVHSAMAQSTDANDRGKISSVSRPVVLAQNEELLIQPGYLQTTPLHALKETKWLLDASIPFASLLSGLYMLTRVSPFGSEPIVISSTRDALSEVGILALPAGAAFVCQPRSLVGVIQDRTNPIRITRHWRLGSLHSWLTLQLRFLAFHGPGQLVMKGCRGIRIEPAGMGRLINQAATLGFSANIEYANTRCETFVSYWSGAEELFNDLFSGESGSYVYEEMPDLRRTTGFAGRGLEGLANGILKVFGI